VNGVRLPPPLLALTPGDVEQARAGELERRVRAAVEGGLRGLVLREPGLGDGAYAALAGRLRGILDEVEGWLAVHDRAHLARGARADGIHLGFRSLAPEQVRPWEPATALGLSTHAGDEPALWEPADYLFHGPVNETPKDPPLEPVGRAGIETAVAATQRPLWALGGISPRDVPDLLEAGARGVAVLAGILPAGDPRARAAAYVAALSGAADTSMAP
jgi:thiamine-phosphate diphosphorylase